MAVNSTPEELGIVDLINKHIKPLTDAIRKAGFTVKVNAYMAARFDYRCGANLVVSSELRPHWGNHLRLTAHWKTGELDKVTSKVREQRTIILGGKNIERIVARLCADFEADIAYDKRMAEHSLNAQAWFDRACLDFRDYQLCPSLTSDSTQPRSRFERLNVGTHKQKIGTYTPQIDCRDFEELTAFQVKALSDFLKRLPDLKAP